MDKTMVIYVSTSSDPRTAHIGRYFLDFRDTSRPAQDPRGRQMTTRVTDNPAEFIREATAEGLRQGVLVTFENETGEGLGA
jgi:hypothetical protein